MGKHSFWLNSTFLAGFKENSRLFSPGSVCAPHDSIQEDCTQQLPVNNQQHPTVKNCSYHIEYHVEQQPHVHWLVPCAHLQRIQEPLASSIVSFGAKNIPNFSQKEAQLQMLDNSWYSAEDTAQSDHNHEDAIISLHKCWVLGLGFSDEKSKPDLICLWSIITYQFSGTKIGGKQWPLACWNENSFSKFMSSTRERERLKKNQFHQLLNCTCWSFKPAVTSFGIEELISSWCNTLCCSNELFFLPPTCCSAASVAEPIKAARALLNTFSAWKKSMFVILVSLSAIFFQG